MVTHSHRQPYRSWQPGIPGSATLLTACCLALGGCAPYSGPPRLVVPQSPLHLGGGVPGEELTGSIALKNEGGDTLQIHQVSAGCACSSLRLTQETVAPGQQVLLTVAARLKEGQNLFFPVRIASNDPTAPEAIVMIRADLAPPPLRADPAHLDFGQVAVGINPSQRLELRRGDGSPWPAEEAVTVESMKGLVRAEALPRNTAGSATGLVLEVRPRSDLPAGAFADTLLLRPAGSDRVVQVAVEGHLVPPIVAVPSAVYFGDLDQRSGLLTRLVHLKRTDGKRLPRLVRNTVPPGLQVDESKLESGQAIHMRRIVVTLDPSLVREDLKDGKLLLWLENEAEPVTIKVMAFLSRKVAQAQPE